MKTTLPLTARKFLDNVHALIIVLNLEGNIDFANQYAADLLGQDREAMIGKNWFNHFVPREYRADLKTRFKKLINGRQIKTNTNYVETKEGDLHLIEWHSTFVQDKKGEVMGTFSSGEDITEKHILKLYLADQQAKHRQDRLNGILEAAERERQFLAYELHDGVNQVLTTCKLLLESELKCGSTSGNVQKAFDYLKEVINTLRELSHELNPAELGNEGLYEAAKELFSRINATGKVEITTKVKGFSYLKKLCPQISLSLYRIMQEALTNIIKHAQAKKVTVNLMTSPGAVDLEIIDDGKGFDRSQEKIGLGLKTIYTRAEAAGGKAHIISSPGEGTLLSVHVPIAFGADSSAE